MTLAQLQYKQHYFIKGNRLPSIGSNKYVQMLCNKRCNTIMTHTTPLRHFSLDILMLSSHEQSLLVLLALLPVFLAVETYTCKCVSKQFISWICITFTIYCVEFGIVFHLLNKAYDYSCNSYFTTYSIYYNTPKFISNILQTYTIVDDHAINFSCTNMIQT